MIYGTIEGAVKRTGANGMWNLFGTLDDLEDAVHFSAEWLHRVKRVHRFDSIVVQGMSGVIVGSPVSLMLDIPLVVCRKPNDGSHCYGNLVINRKSIGERYVFLDDFSSTGDTEQQAKSTLFDSGIRSMQVGAFFYHSGGSNNVGWNERKAYP